MSADRVGDESPQQADAARPGSESDQAHAESLISPFDGPAKSRRGAGRNLPLAIASAVVLLAWIMATLLWWNWGFVIFLMAAAVAGAYEVISALGKAKLQGVFAPIAIGTPLMFATSYWIAQDAGQLAGVAVTLGGLAMMVIVCLAARLRGPVRGFMGDAAASVLTIGYVPLLLSTLTLLLAQPDGNLRIIYYFLLVPCADTAAYAVGSLLGRHKLAPHISPGKTWEGFAGAVLLTALAGALIGPPLVGAAWWVGAIIGALLATAATIGDLIESMIKRDAGLKDMSKLVPGHGGAMDRLDSLLVAAPFAWASMLALV